MEILPGIWEGTSRERDGEDPQDFWVPSKAVKTAAGHQHDLDLATLQLSLQCMSTQVLHGHSTALGSQVRNRSSLFIQTNGTHGNRPGKVWDSCFGYAGRWSRKAEEQEGNGLQSWFEDGERVQEAHGEVLHLSKHGQDQAFLLMELYKTLPQRDRCTSLQNQAPPLPFTITFSQVPRVPFFQLGLQSRSQIETSCLFFWGGWLCCFGFFNWVV